MILLKKDEVKDGEEATQQAQKLAKKKVLKQQDFKQEFEKKLTQLKNQKYKEEQEIIEILLKDIDLLKLVKEKVVHNRFSKYDESLSFAQNLDQSHFVVIAVHNILLGLRPFEFEHINIAFKERKRLLQLEYKIV